MTLQSFFDVAIRGIVAQGGPAFDISRGACLYRQPMEDGTCRKCAIGQHIPDACYIPEMDRANLEAVLDSVRDGELRIGNEEDHNVARYPVPARDIGWLDGINSGTARELQRVHDRATGDAEHAADDGTFSIGAFWDALRRLATDFARQHGLNVDAIAAIPVTGWDSVET